MIFDKEDYKAYDADLWNAIAKEEERQQNNIELIASENVVSKAVMAAQGSILTNKYAEGYPGRRYYGGTDVVDVVESLAIERAKEIFGAKFANVQPHSGSQANCAAYMALIEPGDTVMGMDLAAGGHLTHGASVSFSGQTYNFVSYSVDPETELLDFDAILKQAQEVKPKLIVAGASAYSHIIDFSKFREIADAVGAKLMVDMAHIAGLVAAGLHPSPVPYAHITTTTTHKTLRGPRGGLILTNDEELAKKINSAIFPGIQGGPLEHAIAAKAVAFKEALDPAFKEYAANVIKNSQAMADVFLQDPDFRVISGGTENHLFLVDVTKVVENGKVAQNLLDEVNITLNKNSIPYETLSPFKTSGIRIGAAAITARGFGEKESRTVAELMIKALKNADKQEVPYAHITTTTTHKTLRGPRGGLILTNDEELAKKINSAIFPGIQGGPLEHAIAAKAVAFKEALDPAFKEYAANVIKNSQAMADVFLQDPDFRVISGGTENHLFLVDVTKVVENGKVAQNLLDEVNITLNKNSIPYETLSPFKTSGIRIGAAAITARGFGEKESRTVAELMIKALKNADKQEVLDEVRSQVKALTDAFPLYEV